MQERAGAWHSSCGAGRLGKGRGEGRMGVESDGVGLRNKALRAEDEGQHLQAGGPWLLSWRKES